MDPSRGLIITRAEADLALDAMASMARRRHGWLNVVPEIPDDVPVPATPGALAVFSKRGPAVPMGTWTAPSTVRARDEPAQLGIQHGLGGLAVPKLGATTAAVAATWRVLQDHPRRGLVVVPPSDLPHATVLDWLLVALDVLCLVPHSGRFLVYVYEPDGSGA